MADFTKYIFKNKEYGKGKLVLAVVGQYIKDNNANYSSLLNIFPADLQGSCGVFISEDALNKKNLTSKDTRDRYFTKEDESLLTIDGIKIFVSNQWGTKENGPGNFDHFLIKVKVIGYVITEKWNMKKSIKDLFEEYKKNPNSDWMASFKVSTDNLLSYKDKGPADYDLAILEEVWKSPHNGVSSVRPGFISNREYEALVDDLPEITSKIIDDPSPGTLDEVESWAKEAKNKGWFSTIKWGVINRVFSTVNPRDCSTLLDEKKVLNLINKLNELYNCGISTKGNWAALNLSLMNALRSNGLDGEDVYMVNTFVWWLHTTLVKNDSKSQVTLEDNITNLDRKSSCINIIFINYFF